MAAKKPKQFSAIDDNRIRRIIALAEVSSKTAEKKWSTEAIFQILDDTIIGNEKYKRTLSISLSDYLSETGNRNHLLVVGGSGTGKSYLLEQCLPKLGIQYVTIDGSSLVPAGYVGNTLKSTLEPFFKSIADKSKRSLIILDEFDKISEFANGGDEHKSQSIQSELLTLIQGKNEGVIDTRNSLWILLGAFAYTEEMQTKNFKIQKSALLKYGFKNELLGRITNITHTDIPTTEQVLRRISSDRVLISFYESMKTVGYDVDFTDEAFLELCMAAQNPAFGMRLIPSVIAELKEELIFNRDKGHTVIDNNLIQNIIKNITG